jgi:hypothetical protein
VVVVGCSVVVADDTIAGVSGVVVVVELDWIVVVVDVVVVDGVVVDGVVVDGVVVDGVVVDGVVVDVTIAGVSGVVVIVELD